MNEQRRHHSRIAFDSPARLLLGEQPFAVRVLDLSLKGALLHLPESVDLQPSAAAELRLPLDHAGTEVCMQTTVVYVEGFRAGLACQLIDVDSVTHLRRLLELNLGDADLLQRELSELLAEP